MLGRLLLPCLLLATPAAAQFITEAQAIASVKAAAKAALKEYKAAVKAAQDTLDDALDDVDGALTENSTAATVVVNTGEAVADWLAASDAALFQAVDAVNQQISFALDDMGVPPGGDFPDSFGYGTAGVLDGALAKVRKAATSARNAVDKRVRKTMARAEKVSGLAMSLTLEYPRKLDFAAIETEDTEAGPVGAELELAVGGSRLDTDADGVVFVAGNSDVDSPDIGLALLDADGTIDTVTAAFVAGPFTFSGTLNDITGVPEGIFLVSVAQGDGPPRGLLGITVR